MQVEKKQVVDEEITLADIAHFFKCSWIKILLGGVVGLLFAASYAARQPDKYEAVWQMQMAQINNKNSEEPAVLIQRLRLPTAYSVEVRHSCGMPANGEFGDYLGRQLEVQKTKDLSTVVDMRFRASDASLAKRCAEAIVMMISDQQRSLVEEHISEVKKQIVQYQQTMEVERQQLERVKIFAQSNLGFWARLDKLSWLNERITSLSREISSLQNQQAKLMAPIYAPSKPLPSRAGMVLWLGALFGLMLGMFYAVWQKRRSSAA